MRAILASLIISLTFLTSCARDLSSDMYTSDSTMSLTMEGEVISVRKVKIKDTDRLGDNQAGIMTGALAGGVAGSVAGNNSGAAIIGGAVVGGLVGAGVEQALSTQTGFEYIVKINREQLADTYFEGSREMSKAISSAKASGFITVVQSAKDPLKEGQHVYVIVSDKRTRIIPHN